MALGAARLAAGALLVRAAAASGSAVDTLRAAAEIPAGRPRALHLLGRVMALSSMSTTGRHLVTPGLQ